MGKRDHTSSRNTLRNHCSTRTESSISDATLYLQQSMATSKGTGTMRDIWEQAAKNSTLKILPTGWSI